MNTLNLSDRSSPRSNMTMSKGAMVCDEIKLSALMKLAQISEEKQREAELAEELLENEAVQQSVTEISQTLDDYDDSREESFEDDTAAAYRMQIYLLEQQRLCRVQATLVSRAAQLQAHCENIRASLAARAKQREKERREEEEKEKAELSDLETLERNRTSLVLQLQAKKHQEQAKKIERLIEEAGRSEQLRRDEHRHKRELLEKIISRQQRFRDVFQQISDMLWRFPHRDDMVAAVTPAVSAIKSLSDMMDTLVKQFKVGEVSQLDLTTAENLVEKLESGHQTIKNKLDEISKKKEEEAAASRETTPPAESDQSQSSEATAPESPGVEPQAASPAQPEPPTPTKGAEPAGGEVAGSPSKVHITGLEGYISPENLSELTRLQSLLETHLNSLQPLDADPKLKKFRFQCQMAVNTPLNAISAVSSAHLRDKLRRLQSLLRGQPVEVSSSRVAASSHQLGVAFCTNLLAERIVDQGEQTVSSKPESAFPIAAVALALWAEFPQFGELLMAHFYNQCPYLVPYYAPRTADMTDKQFYSAQGYRYNSEGQVEPHDKFLKRMTGTAQLYFAILTARPPRDLGLATPPTLAKTWRWLASLLNLEPRPDISATVLLTCLEVAGSTLAANFSKQFNKLFLAVARLYYPHIKQVSPSGVSGPISRLEIFLQSSVKNSSIPPPAGILPPHFW